MANMHRYNLQAYHIKQIKITINKKFHKGKTNFILEFLDPCDQITQMHFFPDIDPFRDHDFTLSIPNPLTRKKAISDNSYKECTIEKSGLWLAKEWSKAKTV